MESYYLDTNMYHYLALDRSDCAKRLKSAIRASKCRVFGSMEVLEEFGGLASKPDEWNQVFDLYWELVERNVLDYARDLIGRERRKDNQLAIAEMRIRRGEVGKLRRLRGRFELMSAVGRDVKSGKSDYANDGRRTAKESAAALEALANGNRAKLREVRDDLSGRFVDEEEVRLAFDAWFGEDLPGQKPDPHLRLPCMRAAVSITVARMYRSNSTQPASDKPSDQFDNFHYVLAAGVGALVTRDRLLRRALHRITWKKVPTLNSDDFCRIVDAL